MTGETIGDLVTGALAARAAEPAHGQASGECHCEGVLCLNCQTALQGPHCHQCGQAAHVHRTLGAFFHDLLHGVLHFEGKMWRTLPLLIWQPGRLTREYIDGRRARYVSPIGLFLFVVFATFAIFNAISSPIDLGPRSPTEMNEARAEADQLIAQLEAEKAEALKEGQSIPGIDGQLAGARAARAGLDNVVADEDRPGAGWTRLPDVVSDNDAINQSWRQAKENPELLIYKFQSNAYKFSWLLIPLSVPFVWLLMPLQRRFKMYDHTVFVTYSLSFMLLLIGVISLLGLINALDWIIAVLMAYAPFHMYRQLRGTYELTRFGAWWRTWLLAMFALFALAMFIVSLTFMAAG